jgi:hypothetical protein
LVTVPAMLLVPLSGWPKSTTMIAPQKTVTTFCWGLKSGWEARMVNWRASLFPLSGMSRMV